MGEEERASAISTEMYDYPVPCWWYSLSLSTTQAKTSFIRLNEYKLGGILLVVEYFEKRAWASQKWLTLDNYQQICVQCVAQNSVQSLPTPSFFSLCVTSQITYMCTHFCNARSSMAFLKYHDISCNLQYFTSILIYLFKFHTKMLCTILRSFHDGVIPIQTTSVWHINATLWRPQRQRYYYCY